MSKSHNNVCSIDDWQKKRASLKPSTISNSTKRAKVNKKFIIFTLTIAAQGQLTLKFIYNENVTVKNETEMEKKNVELELLSDAKLGHS